MEGYLRTLIAKEIELGFLYIPSEIRKSFPSKNSQVTIYLDKDEKPLSLAYSSLHHRVFGLTG